MKGIKCGTDEDQLIIRFSKQPYRKKQMNIVSSLITDLEGAMANILTVFNEIVHMFLHKGNH